MAIRIKYALFKYDGVTNACNERANRFLQKNVYENTRFNHITDLTLQYFLLA